MPIFTVFGGGGGTGTTYSRGSAKYGASSSGHHAENEALQGKLSLLTYGIFFCVGYGVLPVSFLQCAQMPRTAGKMGFLHCRCQICNMKAKIGVSEKRAKYISGAAPIMIFVFYFLNFRDLLGRRVWKCPKT